ncbi:hypothetical protein [Priestia abyssalis]|nr:hypothetical protein [Priestia abyssalis]
MTKRNRKTKAGAQSPKAITEFASEFAANPASKQAKQTEKSRPHQG